GAMNNIDKNFVFDISRGLSRRFTFISIYPPAQEFFSAEVENAKIKAKKRVCTKMGTFGDVTIDDGYFERILKDTDFRDAEIILWNLLKQIRYENDDTYLGLMIGTAQIIDVYETIFLNMIVGKYLEDDNKSVAIKKIVDSAVYNRIVPQMIDYKYEKLNSFYESLHNKDEYSWFIKTKIGIKSLV
ncbi:MAG: hypothetical protein PHC56_09490, partial [Herbinix sp.]|nr:hypothetical protein [Herbinix sp.]